MKKTYRNINIFFININFNPCVVIHTTMNSIVITHLFRLSGFVTYLVWGYFIKHLLLFFCCVLQENTFLELITYDISLNAAKSL